MMLLLLLMMMIAIVRRRHRFFDERRRSRRARRAGRRSPVVHAHGSGQRNGAKKIADRLEEVLGRFVESPLGVAARRVRRRGRFCCRCRFCADDRGVAAARAVGDIVVPDRIRARRMLR